MAPYKVVAEDYIQFVIATAKAYTCTEAAKVHPSSSLPPAHDAFNRLLHRLEPDPIILWEEVRSQVRGGGFLVIDDSTLDKHYAKHIQLVTRHWSGKHRQVVQGINLITLLWTDGERHLPCDYRLYAPHQDGCTKNDHFRTMVDAAKARGLTPEAVLFDGWYSSIDNLKRVRMHGWIWFTRLKSNRKVRIQKQPPQRLESIAISEAGTVVFLPGYGEILVFRLVTPDGRTEHWATNHLTMTPGTRQKLEEISWTIENYHKAIKQCCGIERCQVRYERGQRNHILLALRAFIRLEYHCFHGGYSWFEAKAEILRPAIRAYLAQPLYIRPPKAA
jgi:hypothetical protein